MFLVQHLLDVGPTMPGGFGPVPLTHGEIRAWQDNTGHDLPPWWVWLLRRLSFVWIEQARASEEPDCPPPIAFRIDREAVARKIDAFFG